jgi:hypothetical protein
MKKNVLMKGILLLLVIALLVVGLTGCGTIIPIMGTVYITVLGTYSYLPYEVWMDGAYYGITSGGSFVINNVFPGSHYFYVEDAWYYYYWEDITQYIPAGISYVTLYPY